MNLNEFDEYVRGILAIDQLSQVDVSMNGLQVSAGPSDRTVRKAAFAVDACMDSFRRAAEAGADILFVHHGLFWGRPLAVTGSHYERLDFLFRNSLALYAAHLPLDMHPEYGNNAGIAAAIGLENIRPFGRYRGVDIGFIGELRNPAGIDDIIKDMGLTRERCLSVLPFGPQRISRVAVVSGGAADDVHEAIALSADLYITGDASHQIYHTCLENGINLVCGGHYNTETWGVRLLAEKIESDTGMECFFIDVPTGL